MIGVGDTAVTVWNIAKWPVLLLIVSFMFAVLYWAAPNVKQPGFRWISPGGILAVIGWIIASAAFAFYVGELRLLQQDLRRARRRRSCSCVWLWISNIAILLGAEFNAGARARPGDRGGHAPRGRSRSSSRATARKARGPALALQHEQLEADVGVEQQLAVVREDLRPSASLDDCLERVLPSPPGR